MIQCEICEKGDGISGKVRVFKTNYGFRMHMKKVHCKVYKNGKWRRVR